MPAVGDGVRRRCSFVTGTLKLTFEKQLNTNGNDLHYQPNKNFLLETRKRNSLSRQPSLSQMLEHSVCCRDSIVLIESGGYA